MSTHKIDKSVNYKMADSAWNIHEADIDIEANQIYLVGTKDLMVGVGADDTEEPGVEFMMASRFIKNINILMRKNHTDPILVHMKTCGGHWGEGMAIHNIIQACPNPVTILNYTHARSMSSLIFQSANKRVMMPDSYFMLHDGTLSASGTVKEVNSLIAFEKHTETRMMDIYVKSMKQRGIFSEKSEAWIRKMLRRRMDKKEDVYLTAKEAVAFGLADEIFGVTMKYDWNALTTYTDEQLSRGLDNIPDNAADKKAA